MMIMNETMITKIQRKGNQSPHVMERRKWTNSSLQPESPKVIGDTTFGPITCPVTLPMS